MFRRVLLVAATAAACSVPSAQAAPPYCVTVSDGGGTIASTCAVGTGCAVYGTLYDLAYCFPWP